MLLLVKMFESCRSLPWYLDVAHWMQTEAQARVSVYVRRIQNMFWHMKFSAFRQVLRDSIGAREKIAAYTHDVVVIQAWGRRLVHKLRAQRLAQVFITKFIPDVGEPYWSNPSTRVVSLTRPLILGEFDCLSVALPPPGLEFVVQCSNCASKASLNCWDCEDSYCRQCYDDLHCKVRYTGIPVDNIHTLI